MKIGIFGRTEIDNKNILKKSQEIGKLIASFGYTIITGGVEGYPHVVALSSLENGGKVISYAAGLKIEDHKKYHNTDLSKYTKVVFQKKTYKKKISAIDNYLRSLDMCLDVDKAIVIGGRVGTMYELTILSAMNKDVFILSGSGGISGKTAKNFIKEGHKNPSVINFFKDASELKKILKKYEK